MGKRPRLEDIGPGEAVEGVEYYCPHERIVEICRLNKDGNRRFLTIREDVSDEDVSSDEESGEEESSEAAPEQRSARGEEASEEEASEEEREAESDDEYTSGDSPVAAPVAKKQPKKSKKPPGIHDSIVQLARWELQICCSGAWCHGKKAHAPSHFVPNAKSAPRENVAYEAALTALDAAIKEEDAVGFEAARKAIGESGVKTCQTCRNGGVAAMAKYKAKCDAEWERMKREEFHTCGKCGAKRAGEANHFASYADNAKLYNECVKAEGVKVAERKFPREERKLECLSATCQWPRPRFGGVDGMRAEAAKCGPLCRMCHMIDPSSPAANENKAHPDKVKRKDYTSNQAFKQAQGDARRRMDKRDYINAIKRKIGRCENPEKCPCDGPSGGECKARFEQCYDWDHFLQATKRAGISEIVSDTRCLKTVKPLIHDELGLPLDWDIEKDPVPPAAERRCRLLCNLCHHTRSKWDTAA